MHATLGRRMHSTLGGRLPPRPLEQTSLPHSVSLHVFPHSLLPLFLTHRFPVFGIVSEQSHVGIVSEQSQEHGDVVINFMVHNLETKTFTWPPRNDECPVPYEHVLFTVPAQLPMGSSGRQYKLASNIVEDIVKKFKIRISK